jgi:hypothetical protein
MKITIGTETRDERIKISVQGCNMQKGMAWVRFASLLLTIGVCLLMARPGSAQSTISGDIIGTVTDSTGSVVPSATVNLASSDTGSSSTQTTGPSGTFRFSLVKPGNYTLTVTAKGFSTRKQEVVARTGQVIDIPVKLELGQVTQTIEITAAAPLVETTNANLTTTVDNATATIIPNPGQDITNLALTAPGVSISTGGGYGNFSANGLPGTANLFTVNGADYNDPSNNLQNSGASNMALGTNELQEATVVLNGYTAQYGRGAGANLNYSTKSGTNQFHGNAIWFWNGTRLNANDWFRNAVPSGAAPREHAVSNQWAGSFGGPIIKNKLFFFYNNEGTRYVLPGGGTAYSPTAVFASAVQANLSAINAPSAVQDLYKTMFSLYAGAPGSNSAQPVAFAADPKLGCGDFSGTTVNGTTFGGAATATPCAQIFQSNVNNINIERLMSVTVDWIATSADTLKIRWKQDRGVQATGTDPINAAFNTNSNQPEWDAQVNWSHTFNGQVVNQLIASGLHYGALFGPPIISVALGAFPTTVVFGDAPFANMGGQDFNYPQGRNVGQYQIVDDFSWAKGNHGIKFGVDFRRVNLSDFSGGVYTSGEVDMNSNTNFYNGVISAAGGGDFIQRFASANDVAEKNYSLGVYAQDEWKATNRLQLTLAVRFDRNSPAVCNNNCFTRFTTQFQNLNHDASIPYSQSLALNSHFAVPNTEKVVFGPRIGVAWTPTENPTMVVRGGVGIFSDLYPLNLASRFFTNLPNVTGFTLTPTKVTNDNLWYAPAAPNSVFAQTAASNIALRNAIANGGTLASIQAAVAPLTFAKPSFFSVVNNFRNPKYLEWNLEIDKTFWGGKTAVTAGYVGNHGYDLVLQNYGLNAYCDPKVSAVCSNGAFGSLPESAPDTRFSRINEVTNNGRSNYHGVTLSFRQQATKGLYGGATFTYFHSLDNISNGGFFRFSYNNLLTTGNDGDSLRYQIDPNNPNSPSYGNSDYDFRHTFSAYYVWALPLKPAGFLGQIVGGWTVSQVFIVRGGEPFSVYNNTLAGNLKNGSSLSPLAVYLGGPMTCGPSGASTHCLSPSNFATTSTQQNYPGAVFGNLARNSFRGPGYFDADLSLYKDIKVKEAMTFTIGANAFNVLNHPNFLNPNANVADTATFGSITSTAGAPNSPYGNFTGAVVNGRILQLVAKFKF